MFEEIEDTGASALGLEVELEGKSIEDGIFEVMEDIGVSADGVTVELASWGSVEELKGSGEREVTIARLSALGVTTLSIKEVSFDGMFEDTNDRKSAVSCTVFCTDDAKCVE